MTKVTNDARWLLSSARDYFWFRKYHPDKNKGKNETSENFRQRYLMTLSQSEEAKVIVTNT